MPIKAYYSEAVSNFLRTTTNVSSAF